MADKYTRGTRVCYVAGVHVMIQSIQPEPRGAVAESKLITFSAVGRDRRPQRFAVRGWGRGPRVHLRAPRQPRERFVAGLRQRLLLGAARIHRGRVF